MKKTLYILIMFLFFCLVSNVFAAQASIGTTQYDTLSQAITASGSTTATIKIISDINLVEKLTFPKGCNITLDLNGKKINVPTIENNYGMVVSGNLTIKGEGIVDLGTYGIGVSATGNLTIEGGTYKCLAGDYLLGSWGTTVIKNGLFDGNYCIANGFENGTVKILDGTFYSKESTIVLGSVEIYSGAFNQNVDEYLAEGIEMKQYNGLYFTGKTYKVTVEEYQNGVVTVVSEAVAEQPVKVTATPNKGYELGDIKVTDVDGKIIAVSNSEFVMPNSNAMVLVTFESTTLDNTPQTGSGNIIIYLYALIICIAAILFCKYIWQKRRD